MEENLLIEASAGTGKTQALGMRLIELLRGGVKPQEIVALTFSRAAAGEIFERFVSLLAAGAASDRNDARLLRQVIATQHLSQIGTLDSFLMRIARAFPLELGLSPTLELMDAHRESVERSRVSFSILRRTDAATKRAFTDAFALAMNGENVRSFVESYRAFISRWHEAVSAMPEASAWGEAAAIWGREPAFARVTVKELEAAADAIENLRDTPAWHDFAGWVRGFRGRFGTLRGIAKKLLDGGDAFAGDVISFTFSRREYSFGREETLAVRDALMCVYGYVVRMKLEYARGVYRMISAFEKEYSAKVRAAGRLVFSDVPRLIAALPEHKRLSLEYRMDSRVGAWALDEFQDTSREQWKALSNLLDEAKQSAGSKSLFIVGDRKQAIYGWRNGDVGIFLRERESGAYRLEELKKTYRSGPAVIEAVNRVFVDGRIRAEFPAWESPRHETARPELGGFVRVTEAPGGRKEDFIEPVFNALKANAGKGVSAAVLVRSNALGELLADGLKAMGLKDVVWEGESAILDTPALTPFLDLMQLADHPGDMLAYRHFAMTELCRAKYPGGVPGPAEISCEMAESFTQRGIVRTLRELRSHLAEAPGEAWSEFTESRFTDMLRAAGEFELLMSSGGRLADFAGFLAAKKKRNVAEPGKIKIMTIHRSKGLGFDYVVLPLYEHEGLSAESSAPLVGEGWILPNPGSRVAKAVGGLERAYRLGKDRAEQEALATYYVAMTRAKSAMTVILHPAGASLRFSDIVRSADIGEIGEGPVAGSGDTPAAGGEEELPDMPERQPRSRLKRRLPSLSFRNGQSAGELFMPKSRRSQALSRGVEMHARYERIEWLEPAEVKTDLDRRLVRPEGEVELWRERPFEVFAGNAWISGRFDRVVFTGRGKNMRAVIYDYKTNRKRPDESDVDFAARMKHSYRQQMDSYREALQLLTGIPGERISAVLLLTETGEAVTV